MDARIVTIGDDTTSAVIDPLGATLISLTHSGRPLLAGPGTVRPTAGHHGAPWPNRIDRGRYRFEGVDHQLPINDPAYGHAIHGFVFDRQWMLVRHTATAAEFSVEIRDEPGYPFEIALTVAYEALPDGLVVRANWRNLGRTAAPFGIGFHPYFIAGDSPLDDWQLTLEAATLLDVDPTTALPTVRGPVSTSDFDFRSGARLGDRTFSRAFTDLATLNDRWRITLTDPGPSGRTLTVSGSSAFSWVQIFTGDVKDPDLRRVGLAIEPQTCPPNGFAVEEDVLLRPGADQSADWCVRVAP